MHHFLGFDQIVCERLTVTLLHFLWQGAAIGIVAAFLSRMLLLASSQVKYMIHLAAMLAMCCCLPITFSLVTVPERVSVASATIDKSPTLATTNDHPARKSALPMPVIDANPIRIVPNDSSELADADVSPGQPVRPQTSRTLLMASSGESDSQAERYLSRLAPYVTVIYLAGVVMLLVRLMRSAWLTRRLGRSATVVTDIDLLYRMRTQAERLGLRILPALRWCNEVPVPVVIGVLRPIVLLPTYAATGLTMDQLQAVIAHELAHIRRYDLVVNVLQRVIESLLFFHPAVWWVSRQIASEREQACDDLVLTVGPGRAQYADALVKMAELSCQFGQVPVTALATTGSSTTEFKRRILKVLEIDAGPKIRPSRIAAVMASLVVLLTLAMLLFWSGALASGGTEGQDRTESSGDDLTQGKLVPSDEPLSHPILQMVESAGTQYNGGDVVLAHIGYTPPVRDAWMNWLEKDATTSLEKLPAGKYWLIAKHPWTVFPVELPLATSPLKQQPRSGMPSRVHSSNQYSGQLSVEIDDAGKEFIRVDVTNMTDEPWSFSELDLSLGAGWEGKESEAHSPLWLGDDLTKAPRIEVAAKQKGSFRIDWADWVRRGVWDPMSGVQTRTGPPLPAQQPGKIWVRIGGPGFGTLPVALTHAEGIEDERAAWRELDRLNVMVAGSGRQGMSVNLKQAIERNDLDNIAKYQQILDTIPTTADFWQIPTETWPVIGRLKSLTQVRFVGCDLRGQMGHFRKLKNLRKFEVRTGEILPDDLGELGALTNLEVIEVNLSTWFQTEEVVAEMLAKLSEGNRRYCQDGGDVNDTKHRLSMILTNAALARLRNLKQLKVLNLKHTFVTGKGVEELAHLPNLEQFFVDEWYLLTPASMQALGSLKNLRRIPRLSSGATEFIKPLAGLRQLEVLAIDGGDLTDEGLSHLQNMSSLRRLAILRSQVTDAGLMQLADLSQLEQLDIRGVDAVTDAGAQRLRERLPNCWIVRTEADSEAIPAANEVPIAQPPAPEDAPPRIDLIGLTWDTVPKKETWRTNGQPQPVPEWVQQLPKLHGDDKGKPAPLYLFEIHGLKAKPSFRHRYQPAVVSGDEEPPEGRPYRIAVLYEALKNNSFFWGEHPAVRITDEPWGPWRMITKEGQFAEPLDPNTLYREGYEMVTLHGFRPLTKRPNDPEPAADAVRKGLVLKHPNDYDSLYAIEIEAVPSTTGPQLVNVFTSRPIQRFRNDAKDGWDVETEWPVDEQKIDHLRYRIRPYRHRFEFQEITHEPVPRPATSAPFKVIYKKLDHELPRPMAVLKAERAQLADAADRPHFDLQVVDDVTGQPIGGADVRVRHSVSNWQPNNVTPPKLRDFNRQIRTDARAMFPIAFPPEMQGLEQYLQISVRHPDYVIEQSFGAWQVTVEMASNPLLAKEKLFPKGIISFKPGFEVSGQVLSPDGKPAQGVNLYAAAQMPEYLNMPPHAVTDAAGRYRFRVGGFDETLLFIMPADAVALSIPIQEQYGEHPAVTLEAGTVITGRVLDDKGQPVADVVVQGNGNDTVYTGFPNPMARVATDAEGRYKLPPMKLPVDVRVARFGYLGGWSRSHSSPEGVYLPVLLRAPSLGETAETQLDNLKPVEAAHPKSLELDFRPVETVTLTARAYSEKGNLTDEENIELFGVVSDSRVPGDQRVSRWRGSFRSVPGKVGLYQLKAPKGLVNATIDMTNSGSNNSRNLWSRAVREEETFEGPRTNAGWAVLDRDDDSIIVGTPSSNELGNAANAEEKTESTTQDAAARLPPHERTVSLKVDNLPRRQILEQLAAAASLEVVFNEVSLAKTDFDLEQLMSVDFVDEPLWQTVADVCELPSVISAGPVAFYLQNKLIITTIEGEDTRKRTPLPEWLSALQSHGVGGTTDDDGEVTRVSIGEKGLTDDVLARLSELQHLKELTVDPRGPATDAGLAHLSKLHSLETLSITSGETTVFRTDQLLAHVKHLPNLKSISFHESGVSDEGIAHIAELKSIERLSLYQDGRVTDRGIELIAGMPQLKRLDLTQYVFHSYIPKMQYSPEALARIGQLTNLEFLTLDGIDAPSALQTPRGLKGLTLTGSEVNDETAARIAACSNLKSLTLRDAAISDEGLRQIAERTKLSRLSLWETPITDVGIAHLKSLPLRHLEFRQMQLTDLSLSHIAQIKTLSRLDLFGAGPADFFQPRGPGFTLDGMRVLKDLPRLRTLWLTGYPSNANYAALADLKQLRELTFMMALQNEHDLEYLKAELPRTRITASTGGGMVGRP